MASKHEKVLLAAYQKWPEQKFSAEDLVVACWEMYPEDFGLQGYHNLHPDSNVVYRHIMGQNSVVKKQQWLNITGSKTYQLSTKGLKHAMDLIGSETTNSSANGELKARIERSHEEIISRALRSDALRKHRGDEVIVFGEACRFWGISSRTHGEALKKAQEELASALQSADYRLKSEDNLLPIAKTGTISDVDVNQLRLLNEALLEQFQEEVSTINRRILDHGIVRYR